MTASGRPVVAAFDVDGTLTTSDCVVPFLRRTLGTIGIVSQLAARLPQTVAALARRDRDGLKELAVRGFAGRAVTSVDSAGEEFAEVIERTRLRPDTVARLGWHRDQGHRTVLVSASLDPYLRPLARRLGVGEVLCTTLAADGGTLTGRLVGANCRGPEKVRRLDAWLAGEDVELWAYGDSAGDRELLGRADRAHLVKGVVVSAIPAGAR